jgi:outer membrane protein
MTMNKPSMFKRTVVGASLTAVSAMCLAIDLTGSYERALGVDPTIAAASQALLAGREKAVQGNALLKPQVALSASAGVVNQRSSASASPAVAELIKPESSGSQHQVALQASQPLYDATAKAEKKQLQQQTDLAVIKHRQAEQELIQRVGETYFNVLMAQESLRVTRAEKSAVTMQRDRAQARFAVGRGKVTDVQEAEARLDAVLTREILAQSTLALREAQYRELTGASAEALAELRAGFVPKPPQPDDLQAWQSRGLEQNHRVLARRGELVIAGAEIDKYRLGARPTLDLVASYTYKGQGGGLSSGISPDSSRSALVGLQLTVPLYTGGGLDSRQRESVAKKGQAEQELSAAQRDIRLQVQDAFLAVKTGVARVGALEQSVLSARTALEATTLSRDVGTRTELDVLDAQQRLFTAQLDLAQARSDYLLGRLRLASSAGELTPNDLRALDAYLVH